MIETLIISPGDLPKGKTSQNLVLDKSLFSDMENKDIKDAKLNIALHWDKSSDHLYLKMSIDADLLSVCDRCFGDLNLNIKKDLSFSFKFTDELSSLDTDEEGRELIFLPSSDSQIDLEQIIYDYTILSIGVSKMHKDGECDPAVIARLEATNKKEEAVEDSPFAVLKKLI